MSHSAYVELMRSTRRAVISISSSTGREARRVPREPTVPRKVRRKRVDSEEDSSRHRTKTGRGDYRADLKDKITEETTASRPTYPKYPEKTSPCCPSPLCRCGCQKVCPRCELTTSIESLVAVKTAALIEHQERVEVLQAELRQLRAYREARRC